MSYSECLDLVNSLYSYVKTHLQSEFDTKLIDSAIDESEKNHYRLFDAFIILCYIINNSDYKDISSSFSIRDFPFGQLMRKLIVLRDEWWIANMRDKKLEPHEIFPECTELFKSCNTTFLQPADEIVTEVPKGATVISYDIKNCKNMVFNVRNILDADYVSNKYSSVNITTGVNELILDRFHLLVEYKLGKTLEYIVDVDPDKSEIYQQLDNGHYRRLINLKDQDRDYNLINYNMAVVNYENKVMLAMRQTIPQVPKSISYGTIIGKIKNNIYGEKRMKVSDAIFDAYVNPNLSDSEILQIAVSAQMYQDKVPRYTKAADFDKFFNERDMAANIF